MSEHMPLPPKYFTDFTWKKASVYLVAGIYVFACGAVVLLQPWIPVPCNYVPSSEDNFPKYENSAYLYDPCTEERHPQLLYLNKEECDRGRRLVWATFLGAVIGWERRNADRPAGIRTMALVSLGSALFTLCSAYAFISGPMNWDASRVSAAIPSGVGFLGSALIFKHQPEGGEGVHEVHGLTTATSVWLSAAVGIACGGGMYFSGSFCTAIMLILLRFGPRGSDLPSEEEEEEEEAIAATAEASGRSGYDSTQESVPGTVESLEKQQLLPRGASSKSLTNSRRGSKAASKVRLRATLASGT